MELGENIYRLRTKQHMSQGDLAEALDVSRQSVSKWETGSAVPELDKLIKMSKLFGVTLDELVNGTDSPSNGDQAPQHVLAEPLEPIVSPLSEDTPAGSTGKQPLRFRDLPFKKQIGFCFWGLALLLFLYLLFFDQYVSLEQYHAGTVLILLLIFVGGLLIAPSA